MQRMRDWLSSGIIVTALIAAVISFSSMLALGARGDHDTHELPPTLTDQEREALFNPGPEWDGQGRQGISQKEAEAFADYPIFWLGQEFAGYNLQAIIRENYVPEPPIPAYEAMNSVGFGYGDCIIPAGSSACPIPVLIKTEPICLTRPNTVAGAMKASSLVTVRGSAQMLRFADGHLRLWTGRVSIYISAPVNAELTSQMVLQLKGLNTEVSPSEALPPPDFSSCAPVDEHLKTGPPS